MEGGWGGGGGKRREKLPKYKKRKAIQGDILKYESLPPPFEPALQQKFQALHRRRNKDNAILYQNMRVLFFTEFQCWVDCWNQH
jgi:hypothetical protein